MDRETFVAQLKSLVSEYLTIQNLELVDFIYRYEGRDLVLRILVDKPDGGITLDECVYLNTELSRILDERDIIKEKFILEVSSPGLDRPLKTKSDFLRCKNKNVRFIFSEKINGKGEFVATINTATEDSVSVSLAGEETIIPFSKLIKATQIPNAI